MEPDHDRIESILVSALEIQSETERQEYLQQACGDDIDIRLQVQKLIESHFQAGSFLNLADAQNPSADSKLRDQDTWIGPYRLLQKIGEGGMGLVYLAEQLEPFQRQVAVKVIRAGMDSHQVVARFEQERQALAVMDHPNIARVIDGGLTADRRPYFAMELIQGLSITDYCDQHQLTLRQRLELFIPVCLAIQHAHQKGVIHRDLKPSNVLVTESDGVPVPKVIDFGVAKAVGPRLTTASMNTQFGAIIGTLEYMSPEQAVPDHEDIDTRSDIYCLGVLLFELLTGTTPLQRQKLKDVAMLELLRMIREQDPPTPSHRLSTIHDLPSVAASRGVEPRTLSHVVKGDLDWLVMKCLEKDRNRRYSAAAGVAQDIKRFLDHEPIEAGPPGAGYRIRKFVWRNRWASAVVLLLSITLIGGVVGTSIGMVNAARGQAAASRSLQSAEHQRDRAERHYRRALSAVDRLLTRVGGVRLESVPHMDETRRQLLEDALEFYREILREESEDPLVRQEVGMGWQRVGDIQTLLGNPQAEESLKQAIDIQKELLAQFPNDLKYIRDFHRSQRYLAYELFRSGRLPEAERIVEDLLGLDNFANDDTHYEQVLVHFLRARICASTQRSIVAISACEKSLKVLDSITMDASSELEHQSCRAQSLSFLGNLYREDRQLDEAQKYLQEAKTIFEQMLKNEPADISIQASLAAVFNYLGLTYANRDQYHDATTAYKRGIDMYGELVRDHPGLPDYQWSLAKTLNNIGLLHSKNDDPSQAALENEKALKIFEDLKNRYPQRIEFTVSYAGGCGNQAKYLSEQDRSEESIVWNSKAIEVADRLLAIEPRLTELRRGLHNSLIGRAFRYRKLNLGELAIADYRRSLELSEGESHANYVNFRPRALAYAGEHMQAAEAAEAIVSGANATAANFTEMAKVLATCFDVTNQDTRLADTERHDLAEKYALRCVELLALAAKKGRFPTLEHVADLSKDDRLKAIQKRDDFQRLLAELRVAVQPQE